MASAEEYVGCLMTEERLMFYDEIDTEDLFDGKNEREKILIFSIGWGVSDNGIVGKDEVI